MHKPTQAAPDTTTEENITPGKRRTTAQKTQAAFRLKEEIRKKLAESNPELYSEIHESKTETNLITTKDESFSTKGENKQMNYIRNILSIVAGLATYIILEYILVIIILLIASIPILSFIITGIVPINIFVAGTVPYICVPATLYVMSFISVYKNKNYPAIITFGILLLLLLNSLINNFSASNLVSSLIQGGFLIFGIATSSEFNRF